MLKNSKLKNYKNSRKLISYMKLSAIVKWENVLYRNCYSQNRILFTMFTSKNYCCIPDCSNRVT